MLLQIKTFTGEKLAILDEKHNALKTMENIHGYMDHPLVNGAWKERRSEICGIVRGISER